MNKTIYDLGCGTNKTIPEAIGMDVRPVSDIAGSIDTLPFEDNSGNVIISRHSFEHLLDPVKALKEWIRVLKPGGKMLIVLPDHEFINTIDPYYSNGEHLHAYTRESFANLISLFPELHIAKQETVLKDWSFGTVVYKLPTVSVIVPALGREEGLQKCYDSLTAQTYPSNLIDIYTLAGEETVPIKVKQGVEETKGEYIVFAANDTEFTPEAIITAVTESLEFNKGLVAFNTGEPAHEGNMCEHFAIRRDLLPQIGGQVFDTRYKHLGVDQILWKKCSKLGQAMRSKDAVVIHNHFSTGKSEFDEVYARAWNEVDMKKDRELLAKDLIELDLQ